MTPMCWVAGVQDDSSGNVGVGATTNAGGSIDVETNGDWSYTAPYVGFTGTDYFTYTAGGNGYITSAATGHPGVYLCVVKP